MRLFSSSFLRCTHQFSSLCAWNARRKDVLYLGKFKMPWNKAQVWETAVQWYHIWLHERLEIKTPSRSWGAELQHGSKWAQPCTPLNGSSSKEHWQRWDRKFFIIIFPSSHVNLQGIIIIWDSPIFWEKLIFYFRAR